jgi:hypothetical protein
MLRFTLCHDSTRQRLCLRKVAARTIRDLREKEIPERPDDVFGMASHVGTLFCRESLMPLARSAITKEILCGFYGLLWFCLPL